MDAEMADAAVEEALEAGLHPSRVGALYAILETDAAAAWLTGVHASLASGGAWTGPLRPAPPVATAPPSRRRRFATFDAWMAAEVEAEARRSARFGAELAAAGPMKAEPPDPPPRLGVRPPPQPKRYRLP